MFKRKFTVGNWNAQDLEVDLEDGKPLLWWRDNHLPRKVFLFSS
jgi:hypothetical protein